ncbi:MAG: DUF6768 family protein [Parvularculaceae bacterium]|nr:DUF6768 family protein [Parvularculaceae bacterium]
MSKLDRMIEDALGAEDRALFQRFGERGLMGEAAELFTGKMGWWNVLSTLIQVALFAAALYAASKVLTLDDPVLVVRWGVAVSVWFMAMSVIKLMHWQQMQSNRVIREVKRLQLQLARGHDPV